MKRDEQPAGVRTDSPAQRTQSRDTAPDVERLLFDYFRGLSAADKVHIVGELCRAAETYALAGLRQRHPEARPNELRMRLAAMRLGADSMRDAFGWSDSADTGR